MSLRRQALLYAQAHAIARQGQMPSQENASQVKTSQKEPKP
jgi:hypothetical protein